MKVMVNDLTADDTARACRELNQLGYTALACPADVTQAADVARMMDQAQSQLGPVWLLVNNAGSFHAAPVESFPEEQWDRTFAVDVKAAFLCSREVLPGMISSGGRIVIISSIAGSIPRTGQIAYCAAKAAAIHFSRCLAVEVAKHGITVNCLCPGMTDSDMLRETANARGIQVADYVAMIPSGRLARGEDHAQLVGWLASEEASQVTGQVIHVDGAQSLYHPLTLRG
jgi:NAD(P)-dependent dehydrogenase (short-subunit alcohol dehydrogenase family)